MKKNVKQLNFICLFNAISLIVLFELKETNYGLINEENLTKIEKLRAESTFLLKKFVNYYLILVDKEVDYKEPEQINYILIILWALIGSYSFVAEP